MEKMIDSGCIYHYYSIRLQSINYEGEVPFCSRFNSASDIYLLRSSKRLTQNYHSLSEIFG